jgi:hypothetical protein
MKNWKAALNYRRRKKERKTYHHLQAAFYQPAF